MFRFSLEDEGVFPNMAETPQPLVKTRRKSTQFGPYLALANAGLFVTLQN